MLFLLLLLQNICLHFHVSLATSCQACQLACGHCWTALDNCWTEHDCRSILGGLHLNRNGYPNGSGLSAVGMLDPTWQPGSLRGQGAQLDIYLAPSVLSEQGGSQRRDRMPAHIPLECQKKEEKILIRGNQLKCKETYQIKYN